ncbi:redoxin domain-containing protein [Bacillus sp. ISL-47]|nr:redoxin domain-containing protein [Bacillus sp. ISL-47]
MKPSFTLPATGKRTISLSDYHGKKNVCLIFIPNVFGMN